MSETHQSAAGEDDTSRASFHQIFHRDARIEAPFMRVQSPTLLQLLQPYPYRNLVFSAPPLEEDCPTRR